MLGGWLHGGSLLVLPKWTTPRPKAYSLETYPDTDKKGEADYLQCGHCQKIWKVMPGSGEKRGWCWSCSQVLCGKPMCMKHCGGFLHFMKMIERIEARGRWLASIGIGKN